VEVFSRSDRESLTGKFRDVLSQRVLDLAQALQGTLASAVLVGQGQGHSGRGRWWRRPWRPQTDPADLKVLLETVRLQEIGEFERADIAPLGADFALQVGHDCPEVLQRVSGPQQFKPQAFAVEAQA